MTPAYGQRKSAHSQGKGRSRLSINPWEGAGDVGVPPQTPEGDSRNLNRRHGHCRARASFRLTPPVRFALRASAHRAHTNLRPPAPRYWGFAPRGDRVWGLFSALALRIHLGLRPKTPREGLGVKLQFAGNEASEKRRRHLTGFFDKLKRPFARERAFMHLGLELVGAVSGRALRGHQLFLLEVG